VLAVPLHDLRGVPHLHPALCYRDMLAACAGARHHRVARLYPKDLIYGKREHRTLGKGAAS
jgi:hypothetical protein